MVRLRDRQICQCCYRYCGNPDDEKPLKGEVHHIHAIVSGGVDELENMIYLCRYCHSHAPHRPEQFFEYQRSGGRTMQEAIGVLAREKPQDFVLLLTELGSTQLIIDKVRDLNWCLASEWAEEDGF